MRAALWWLLPSDGEFRRAPDSLQYYLARQGRHVVLRGGDVTQPFYESHLNWIPDPAPPAPLRLDDLASSAAAPATPMPSSEAHPRLPGRSRRRRRRKKKTAATANENLAPRVADLATLPTLSANRNSACWASSVATRPRSSANGFPGIQPGTRSALEKHPQSFTIPAANRSSDRSFCLDLPGKRGVYKPARNDLRQDSTANRQRNNFSGSGLSSLLSSNPLPNPSLDRLLGS